MSKIGDHPPPTVYTGGQAQRVLGVSPSTFKRNLADFLLYYQIGNGHRRYLVEDVHKIKTWLEYRQGLIALGYQNKLSPLLPPGETMEEKRHYFEAWWEEDAAGIDCPDCDGRAIQPGLEGPVWCPNCGILQKEQGDE